MIRFLEFSTNFFVEPNHYRLTPASEIFLYPKFLFCMYRGYRCDITLFGFCCQGLPSCIAWCTQFSFEQFWLFTIDFIRCVKFNWIPCLFNFMSQLMCDSVWFLFINNSKLALCKNFKFDFEIRTIFGKCKNK